MRSPYGLNQRMGEPSRPSDHTALLVLYFAGMGPAPYLEFAIPHMYGKHVRLCQTTLRSVVRALADP